MRCTYNHLSRSPKLSSIIIHLKVVPKKAPASQHALRTSKDVKQGSKVVSDYTKIQFNYHIFCDLKAAFVSSMDAE